ncbi:MAG: phospholipase D family protein [Desulfobacteraceae bacterium]|nr:phospholipase D family protein [Desulfobacteraceae bacterium]
MPRGFERTASYAYPNTENTVFGKMFADDIKKYSGKSGFVLLASGLDAFASRIVLANCAQRSIDAQYYLYHDDFIGRIFTYHLLKAADRGVRIRLLVDDINLAGRDLGAAALDSHPNMQVRIFNPFSRNMGRAIQFVTRLGQVTRRMHNKTFIADNQAAILGGRNIGNEYFEADPNISFADLDVLSIGPVVSKVSSSFDLYWNSELAYPAVVLRGKKPTPGQIQKNRQELTDFANKHAGSSYMQALEDSDLGKRIRNNQLNYSWGEAKIVYDQPEKILQSYDKTEYHLSPHLRPYFEAVKKELVIFSAYFVPGKRGTAFFRKLCERGVRVRILTNSLASNDVGIVHAGYTRYRKSLLRAGVELYEMNMKLTRQERKAKKGKRSSSKASLHAKSFVFDRKKVFIGSLNLDPRAFIQNTEIGVVISEDGLAKFMSKEFDRIIKQSAFRLELKKKNGSEQLLWHGLENNRKVVYKNEPHTSFWRRLGIGLMSILPIESHL